MKFFHSALSQLLSYSSPPGSQNSLTPSFLLTGSAGRGASARAAGGAARRVAPPGEFGYVWEDFADSDKINPEVAFKCTDHVVLPHQAHWF